MTIDDPNDQSDHDHHGDPPGDHDHPELALDERLSRLLTERAEGVAATPDLRHVMAEAGRRTTPTHRSRLFYVGSVAAAVVAVIAGIGVVGLVGDDPAVQAPTDQQVEPSTTTTTEVTGSSLSSSTTTVPSTTTTVLLTTTTIPLTTTEQQPADCPPGELPVEDGCMPPSTTTTIPLTTVGG
jgi:hypothetical protein